jgi:hypothetical protein
MRTRPFGLGRRFEIRLETGELSLVAVQQATQVAHVGRELPGDRFDALVSGLLLLRRPLEDPGRFGLGLLEDALRLPAGLGLDVGPQLLRRNERSCSRCDLSRSSSWRRSRITRSSSSATRCLKLSTWPMS